MSSLIEAEELMSRLTNWNKSSVLQTDYYGFEPHPAY